jgi:glucose-6-phosphate-specific signal transduction histidine kinase
MFFEAAAWALDYLTELLLALTYLFAGRQTFWLVLLLDPDSRDCEVTRAEQTNSRPMVMFLTFLIFWPVLLAAGWACAKLDRVAPRFKI